MTFGCVKNRQLRAVFSARLTLVFLLQALKAVVAQARIVVWTAALRPEKAALAFGKLVPAKRLALRVDGAIVMAQSEGNGKRVAPHDRRTEKLFHLRGQFPGLFYTYSFFGKHRRSQ